jgi:hypothetical protein
LRPFFFAPSEKRTAGFGGTGTPADARFLPHQENLRCQNLEGY